ncbi:hypothetical protein ACC692_37300, partial [Rhizobium ruizarguesonis]
LPPSEAESIVSKAGFGRRLLACPRLVAGGMTPSIAVVIVMVMRRKVEAEVVDEIGHLRRAEETRIEVAMAAIQASCG